MIDIDDKSYQPNIEEISNFVDNALFDELCRYMDREYQALVKIEYSGDKVLLGWNLKFKKAGRTLCTVYPRRGHFPMLLVVGPKEKLRAEALLPELSCEFQAIYNNTQEGMGQRWLLFDFQTHTEVFEDALQLIRIRRQSR